MMLHTKYQGFRPCGFRQEDFFRFSLYTRGDQKVRGKVLLNRTAFIDCNENS